MDEHIKYTKTLSKRIIAQKTIDRWRELDSKIGPIQAKDVDNQTLENFFTDIIKNHNAPISSLPTEFKTNKSFLIKLIETKPSLLNQIYLLDENHTMYKEILPEIENLHRLLIRCKCFLIPQIRKDIIFLAGKQPTVEDFLPIPEPKQKKTVR